VVNCAGVIRRGDEHAPDVFADVVDINLTGTMRVCAAARAKLKEARGTIVNTASVLSYLGGGLVPGYAASKGGITPAHQVARHRLCGGRHPRQRRGARLDRDAADEALRENAARSDAILARTPLGRWGKPEDIAGGVLYLSSPIASFVTGTVLAIDGGYLSA
jgi:NAD(P)-dependent dehydrogenase (short-subunit alcohol dehydrogenase family)